jgi:hypothetical protein
LRHGFVSILPVYLCTYPDVHPTVSKIPIKRLPYQCFLRDNF